MDNTINDNNLESLQWSISNNTKMTMGLKFDFLFWGSTLSALLFKDKFGHIVKVLKAGFQQNSGSDKKGLVDDTFDKVLDNIKTSYINEKHPDWRDWIDTVDISVLGARQPVLTDHLYYLFLEDKDNKTFHTLDNWSLDFNINRKAFVPNAQYIINNLLTGLGTADSEGSKNMLAILRWLKSNDAPMPAGGGVTWNTYFDDNGALAAATNALDGGVNDLRLQIYTTAISPTTMTNDYFSSFPACLITAFNGSAKKTVNWTTNTGRSFPENTTIDENALEHGVVVLKNNGKSHLVVYVQTLFKFDIKIATPLAMLEKSKNPDFITLKEAWTSRRKKYGKTYGDSDFKKWWDDPQSKTDNYNPDPDNIESGKTNGEHFTDKYDFDKGILDEGKLTSGIHFYDAEFVCKKDVSNAYRAVFSKVYGADDKTLKYLLQLPEDYKGKFPSIDQRILAALNEFA